MGMVVMSKRELIRLIGSDAYEGVQLKKLKEVTKIVFGKNTSQSTEAPHPTIACTRRKHGDTVLLATART
jgi:hypothetical protein